MAKQIISQERLREALDYNHATGVFTWNIKTARRIKIGNVAGNLNVQQYLQVRIDNRVYLTHRLIWLYIYGRWPINQIDHVNRNRSDNRLCNLREATNMENSKNHSMRKDNMSGVTGVNWNAKNKTWNTRIHHDGKCFYQKTHASKRKAIAIRLALEVMLDYDITHGK